MRRILTLVIVASLGYYGFKHFQAASPPSPSTAPGPSGPERESPFRCDGRTHCSQMTSCEEAVYFLRHCSGAKMDGDNDGVPCEKQWCN